MVYEPADGNARWDAHWTPPLTAGRAARWTYAPIADGRYSPNCLEGEFSEVRLREVATWPNMIRFVLA